MKKINISFKQYTDSNFLKKTDYIKMSMTGNDNFPTPLPTLKDVNDAREKYDAALTAAEGLGLKNVSDKNLARTALELVLAQLGVYVMFVAMGNEGILMSSGYDLRKDPQPRHLQSPGNVTIKNGITSGVLVASVKRNGFSNFNHQITEHLTENSVWVTYPAKTAKFTYTGLVPGKQYWLRVEVIGPRNQSAFSNISTCFVQ